MKRRVCLLLYILCVIAPSLSASIERMNSISTKDGLFSDRFFKSFRDAEGYLWILGINGVARYDGKYITNYEPTNEVNHQYIRGHRLYTIIQDKTNTIWIGGDGGLNFFDPINNTFIPVPLEKHGSRDIRFLEQYNDSSIWISFADHDNYLINIHNHQITKQKETFLLSSSAIDLFGNLWLSTHGGELFINFKKTKLKLKASINDLCFSSSGHLFLATNVGIKLITGIGYEKNTPVLTKASIFKESWLSHRNILTVEYLNGSIWAGTDNGLNKCRLNKQDYPNKIEDYYSQPLYPFSLTNNLITDIYADREGILWISTWGGLNKIDPSIHWFSSLQYDPKNSNGLHDNYIFPIYGDTKGNIWMGSYSSGVSQYLTDSKTFKWYHKDNSELKSNHIRQIYADHSGNTWISTASNVCIYSDGELKPVIFSNTTKRLHGTVFSIIQHQDGHFWLGTRNKIYHLTKQDTYLYEVEKEIDLNKSNEIICFFNDAYNRIWIGTANGLFMLDISHNDNLFAFTKKDRPEMRTNVVQVINADSEGNIWLGSTDGVYVIKNDSTFKNHPEASKFQVFLEEDGLASNYVSGLLMGQNGEMWLSSWKGIMKYDPKRESIHQFTPYAFTEGLVSEKYNRNGYYKDTISNTYYFGSANGVNYFRQRDLSVPNARVLIHFIEVDGNLINATDSILTGIKEYGSIEQLQVSFGSSSLLSPNKQVFAWKLEGRDSEWTYTRDRELSLKDISSGDYILMLRTVSTQDIADNIIQIPITVSSAILRRSLITFLILLIVGITYYHINKSRKQQPKNEKYMFSKLSSDTSSEIIEQLNQLMNDQKPYLDPDLSVNQLADLVGINSVKLSQVLNDFLQIRFYEYVNKYRVEEFIKCLENNENKIMTLLALSEKCGFSSKSSFYRFFKNEKGTTPAQYAKNLNKK